MLGARSADTILKFAYLAFVCRMGADLGQQVTKEKKMAAKKLGVTGHEKKNKRPRLGVNS